LVARDDRSSSTTLAQLNDGLAGGGSGGGGAATSGGREYQHYNRGWNIRAVTDEAGVVLERYLYDPHGKPTVLAPDGVTVRSASTLPGGEQAYGYTAQRYDRETGLWYFKHRYMDHGLGRFISRDPAGYVDGMNLYTAYFVLTGTDPLGLGSNSESPWTSFWGEYNKRSNENVAALGRAIYGAPAAFVRDVKATDAFLTEKARVWNPLTGDPHAQRADVANVADAVVETGTAVVSQVASDTNPE